MEEEEARRFSLSPEWKEEEEEDDGGTGLHAVHLGQAPPQDIASSFLASCQLFVGSCHPPLSHHPTTTTATNFFLIFSVENFG
jgi:hypothetical protein